MSSWWMKSEEKASLVWVYRKIIITFLTVDGQMDYDSRRSTSSCTLPCQEQECVATVGTVSSLGLIFWSSLNLHCFVFWSLAHSGMCFCSQWWVRVVFWIMLPSYQVEPVCPFSSFLAEVPRTGCFCLFICLCTILCTLFRLFCEKISSFWKTQSSSSGNKPQTGDHSEWNNQQPCND